MKHFLFAVTLLCTLTSVQAQNEETFSQSYEKTQQERAAKRKMQNDDEDEKGKLPFKQHLFLGGTADVSFFDGGTILGLKPYFGYSFGSTLDVALQTGYTYTGQRDFDGTKYRQNVISAGTFARLFLIENLFLQGGYEHNFIGQKAIPPANSGLTTAKLNFNVGSTLVGAGYSTGRSRDFKSPFYYVSILFDVTGAAESPYTRILQDGSTQSVPIINAGIQIPLFQGNSRSDR